MITNTRAETVEDVLVQIIICSGYMDTVEHCVFGKHERKLVKDADRMLNSAVAALE